MFEVWGDRGRIALVPVNTATHRVCSFTVYNYTHTLVAVSCG
jgi:hypothetical protein